MPSNPHDLRITLRELLQRAAQAGWWIYHYGAGQDQIQAPPPAAIAVIRQRPTEADILLVLEPTRAVAFRTREGCFDTALRCEYVTWDAVGHPAELLPKLDTSPYSSTPYPRPVLCQLGDLAQLPVHWQRPGTPL